MTKDQHCLNSNDIRCPYCEYSHEIEAEDLPWDDNLDVEKECHGCERVFTIKGNVSVSWITEPPEEEE